MRCIMTICHHSFFPDFIVCPKSPKTSLQYLRLYKKLQRCQQQISSIINSGILSFKCHRLDICTFVTFCATLKIVMPYTACHLAIRVYGRLYGGTVFRIKQKVTKLLTFSLCHLKAIFVGFQML